jgi:hypothetical protein
MPPCFVANKILVANTLVYTRDAGLAMAAHLLALCDSKPGSSIEPSRYFGSGRAAANCMIVVSFSKDS